MTDWEHLRDEDESDRIREIRAVAWVEFVKLSDAHESVLRSLSKAQTEIRQLRAQLEEKS